MKTKKFKLDYKYIIREILLVFVGINLAIWFNNWNASKKSSHDKEVIVSKIKEEIKNNKVELDLARASNQNINKAFKAYSLVYNKSSSVIVVTVEERAKLRKAYPKFFMVKDSVRLDSQKFQYSGETFIQLEIPDITSIAWETIRTINIANEFEYDCLYELESMYNLQARVKKEIDKAVDALQEGNVENLFKVLNVLNQLDSQLIKSYTNMLTIIDKCE